MKVEIKQNILIEHLNYVIKGISSKNIIPVLNCIKFELSDEGLYLTSTDNEIAIKTFIPQTDIINIERCGKIVVSGRYIYDIIKKLPNTTIKIEMNEVTIVAFTIATGNDSSKLYSKA